MQWTTNDSGSGAKMSVTVYTRDFAGMPLMYATRVYPPNPQETFLSTLEVPAARQSATLKETER
jgi:hypothetical protein